MRSHTHEHNYKSRQTEFATVLFGSEITSSTQKALVAVGKITLETLT